MPPHRIGILGATSLLGKELGAALRERGLIGAAAEPRLLRMPPETTEGRDADAGRSLIAFEDEAALVEEFSRERAAELEVLLLAGLAAESRRAWAEAAAAAACTIDLTGALSSQPGAALVAWGRATPPRERLYVTAHPAAQALAVLLEHVERAGACQLASATVFEPASERGWAGIQELEGQTVRMLAAQSQPREVFGAQVAFNLRAGLGAGAEPTLDQVRARILDELGRLRGAARWAPAVELLQAPLFHAHAISLYVQTAAAAPGLAAALAGDGIKLYAPGDGYPDVAAAASEDDLQVGPPRAQADPPGGYWIFATLDNLRRTAMTAAACAQAALQRS